MSSLSIYKAVYKWQISLKKYVYKLKTLWYSVHTMRPTKINADRVSDRCHQNGLSTTGVYKAWHVLLDRKLSPAVSELAELGYTEEEIRKAFKEVLAEIQDDSDVTYAEVVADVLHVKDAVVTGHLKADLTNIFQKADKLGTLRGLEQD